MSKGAALNPSIPACKVPKGGKQMSGSTKHARMTTAAKVENLKGMPKSGSY